MNSVQKWQLKEKLDNTGDQNTPSQRKGRLLEQRCREQGRTDERQIEQNRSERRHSKTVITIEYSTSHTCHGDKQQVGKGDPQHLSGSGKFYRRI